MNKKITIAKKITKVSKIKKKKCFKIKSEKISISCMQGISRFVIIVFVRVRVKIKILMQHFKSMIKIYA